MKQNILALASSALFAFLLLEGVLRVVDPWQVDRYNDHIIGHAVDDLPLPVPGKYHNSRWSATILADGSRAVPDTNLSADCTLVFVGDSVTFGSGVDDADTFVNGIARALPDVHMINMSNSGWNSAQALEAIRRTPADGYLYLIWYNDPMDIPAYIEARRDAIQVNWYDFLYVERYVKAALILQQKRTFPADYPRFWRDLETIAARGDTLLFYDIKHQYQEPIANHVPIAIGIDWHYEQLSVLDGHPDAAGHREAARLMLPSVQEFVSEVCE